MVVNMKKGLKEPVVSNFRVEGYAGKCGYRYRERKPS
jgi:hypothetical protein